MLTAEEIEADRLERERLQPVAALNGVELDANDERLMRALGVIGDARAERGLSSARRQTQAPGRKQPASTPAPSTAGRDLGDIVAERMRAAREGRAPATWAAEPPPAAKPSRPASGADDLESFGEAEANSMRRILETQRCASELQGTSTSASLSLSPVFRLR